MSCTIGLLIQYAYQVLPLQIVAKPGILQEFYDLRAKTGGPAVTDDQIRLMLRSLLEDRFELKFHRESHTLPVYSLQVGKGGPRLKRANSDDQPLIAIARQVSEHSLGNYGGLAEPRLIGHKASVAALTEYLSRDLRSIVFDDTGLTGDFEFELSYIPEQATSDPPAGPGLFQAIQQQLGLKLEAAKRPVETLVIDQVSRPSANRIDS